MSLTILEFTDKTERFLHVSKSSKDLIWLLDADSVSNTVLSERLPREVISQSEMFKFLIFDENSKLTPIDTINVITPLNKIFPKVNDGI